MKKTKMDIKYTFLRVYIKIPFFKRILYPFLTLFSCENIYINEFKLSIILKLNSYPEIDISVYPKNFFNIFKNPKMGI